MSSLPLKPNDPPNPKPVLAWSAQRSSYEDGRYLEKNPSWHEEESPFKVRQIIRMLKQQNLQPKTVCDVGCGVGAVLTELQAHLPSDCVSWGYDISPHAVERASARGNERLHFRVRDVRRDPCDAFFDLILVLDVFEHVEDYMGLVQDIRPKGDLKLFHIPLDLSVQAVIRRNGLLRRRDDFAHLHYFTKETALRTLTDVGYELVDYFFTPRCIEMGDRMVQRLVRGPRKLCFALAPDLTVRILGGYSLLVLAR